MEASRLPDPHGLPLQNDDIAASRTKTSSSRRPLSQKPNLSKSQEKKLLREVQAQQLKSKVVEAFHGFYRAQYGDRWDALVSALNAKPRCACLLNKFADSHAFRQNIVGVRDLRRLPFVSIPLYESPDRFPHPERDDRNVYTCYLLDAASVLAAEALEVAPDDRVLDLCAAPGGKSVAILQHLSFPLGSLTANEWSADRRSRLWKVITDYVPENLRPNVLVTGRDGTQWVQSDLYDKDELYKWTEHRTVQCAKRQLALVNAALKCVNIGGLVVYSTCSISNAENDKVIEKALKKQKREFEILQRAWGIGEKTNYGWIVLPDNWDGWGPLYFSVLRRVS